MSQTLAVSQPMRNTRAMQMIPVIDLLGGVVVRGIGGRRDEYRPIVSQIVDNAQPAAVASAFVKMGFDTVYVADLDAIMGGQPSWNHYQAIADAGLKMWIDAGVRAVEQARELTRFAESVVIGSETLVQSQDLATMLDELSDRTIFSLDLKNGKVLTSVAEWQSLPAVEVARQVIALGARRLIVLDLAKVGERQGVGTEALCRDIRALNGELRLIAGGGVRDAADLESLARAGCDGALVASALHDGRLSVR